MWEPLRFTSSEGKGQIDPIWYVAACCCNGIDPVRRETVIAEENWNSLVCSVTCVYCMSLWCITLCSMSVCRVICTYACVYTSIHLSLSLYIYIYIYIFLYIYIYMHTYMHIHIYIYTCIRIYTHITIHIYIYTYIYIYIYIYKYIHISARGPLGDSEASGLLLLALAERRELLNIWTTYYV